VEFIAHYQIIFYSQPPNKLHLRTAWYLNEHSYKSYYMLLRSLIKNNPVEKSRKRCKRKFIYYFPKGYQGDKYIAWEREYKWEAHLRFQEAFNEAAYTKALRQKEYKKIADAIVRIESKTNLLFSFEKMALRDAVKSPEGAKAFAIGLFDYVYGKEDLEARFEKFVTVIASLPRKQTRVLTWPLVTVFGFLANPAEHIFLKPRVTQSAAIKYKFDFQYRSKPNWVTYQSLLDFALQVWKDTAAYKPRDYIDIQSFIWVMGSEEYPD
jgi:hypothetical protein